MSSFKDLFSLQSTDYAKFRPIYPQELYSYLASLTPAHDLAWDCGTGNGQAAIELANHFKKVVATDPSAKQLENATSHARVEYQVGVAEKSEFKDHRVDLITAAQAFHWFKHELFFQEAKRVLKPGGIVAVWCYGIAKITPEVDAVVKKLYDGILRNYWEPERQMVEDGYRNTLFPLQEIRTPVFQMKADWTLNHLMGYLSTWSALQKYIQKHQSNPLEEIVPELQAAWGNAHTISIQWELGLRVGAISCR